MDKRYVAVLTHYYESHRLQKQSVSLAVRLALVVSGIIWLLRHVAGGESISALSGPASYMTAELFGVDCANPDSPLYGFIGVICFVIGAVFTWRALHMKYAGRSDTLNPEPLVLFLGLAFPVPFSYEIARSCSSRSVVQGSLMLSISNEFVLSLTPVAFVGGGLLFCAGIYSYLHNYLLEKKP